MDEITKELLEALKGSIENAEQEAFESWLADKSPSGDAEQVKRQWEESSDLHDFLSQWKRELAVIAKAEAILAVPQPADDGWIPWEGGECPVAHGTIVDVRLRLGCEGCAVASNWRWCHETRGNPILEGGDIIAYRVVKP